MPQNAAKPVTLRLKLDYAVCEKLCVPAEGKAELVLGRRPSSAGRCARRSRRRACRRRSPSAQVGRSPIRSVRREDGAAAPRVVVDVAAPAGTDVALFAEGPTPEWALPVPARDRRRAGRPAALRVRARRRAARRQIRRRRHHAHGGRGRRAIEVATHLD